MHSRTKPTSVVSAISLVAIPLFLAGGYFLQDTTNYAPGYSEQKFTSIRIGMNEKDVIGVLGKPLRTSGNRPYHEWIYGPPRLQISDDGGLYVSSSDPGPYTYVMADGVGKITSLCGTYLKTDAGTFVGKTLHEF